MTNDEITWIRSAQKGDRQSFSRLVVLYDRRLTALIQRYLSDPFDVEDVYQEVFILAWKNIGRFQFQSDFFTWLFRIGVNQSLNAARRIRTIQGRTYHDQRGDNEAPREYVDPDVNLLHSRQKQDFRDHLEAELAKLPEKQELAFKLKYFQDLKIREIAHIMDSTESAVKTLLFRAGKTLRQTMETYR